MKITTLSPEQKYLRRLIIDISYKRRLSHLGSCLSVIDIIYAIFNIKKSGERFVLSNGHAGLALYAVLEKSGLLADVVMEGLHIHPDRDPGIGVDVSSGSLGQGLPIAVGIALADSKKDVYCVVSDGECSEGSIWEALRIGIEQKVDNLKIVINANGWGAYMPIHTSSLLKRVKGFGYNVKTVDGHNISILSRSIARREKGRPLLIVAETTVEQFPFLKGQDAHYHIMTEEEHLLAGSILI